MPLGAGAVLIIDEAQNLPLPMLEQIRILSNLETDKEKLLQIMLVGQLNLRTLLRSPELRQLDQRVSIRYQLKPLDARGRGAYVAHRLAVAGGAAAVDVHAGALTLVHRCPGGIPRLINMLCDRALLAGFSVQSQPHHARHGAARRQEASTSRRAGAAVRMAAPPRAPMAAGFAVVLLAAASAVGLDGIPV